MERTQREPSAAKKRQSPSRIPVNRPPRVLVAEDDEETLHLVSSALREDGYDTIEVSDGAELLLRFVGNYLDGDEDVAYDLLVSDVRMPGCDGLDILEVLRSAGWSIPAVLMTGFGTRELGARAEALDATLFDKPLDIDELRATVRNMVPWSADEPKRQTPETGVLH
jgi:DNA-binding response OmpR family regulator